MPIQLIYKFRISEMLKKKKKEKENQFENIWIAKFNAFCSYAINYWNRRLRYDPAKNITTKLTTNYRKIPKISPGAYIFSKAPFEGLIFGTKLRFKIDWASIIVGSKFTVFDLFYFVFEGNFPSTSPRPGAYIRRGDLTESFLRYRFGGAYIWRDLYMEGLIFGILR